MSGWTRFTKVFETEQAARDWADSYTQRNWGYSPSASIAQRGEEWVVTITERSSCD